MLQKILSRPFHADGLKLSTSVTRTDHILIAQILEGERAVLSISLSRKFIENDQGERRFGALASLPQWLAQAAEDVILSKR